MLCALLLSPGLKAQYKLENFTDMNQINSLTEEGDYIWVSTSGGVFKRRKSDGSIVTHFNTLNSGISRNRVECMYIDFYGNYWFGTFRGGICKFDGVNWTTYDQIDDFYIYECHEITEDINGNMWFGVNNGKVVKYDGNDSWELIDLQGEWYVDAILGDDDGNVWCGVPGINGGCWKIDPEGNVEVVDGPSNKFSDDAQKQGVSDIVKDRYGYIWFGYTSGVCKLSPFGTWTDYSHLNTSAGYALAQDANGNMWWCGWSGVWKYENNVLTNYKSGNTGDRVDLVLDILYDANGNMWIGSYNGLSKIDYANTTWTEPWTMNALQSNYVETMAFQDNGIALLFGQFTYMIGYYPFYDYFFELTNNPSGCNFSWIKHSVAGSNNHVYTAYLGYGDKTLHLMDYDENGTPECASTSGSFEVEWADGFVTDISYDPAYDLVWIGTQQGLFYRNSGQSIIYNWPTQLPTDYISGMTVNNRTIYYATSEGLGYYDVSTGGYGSITTANGLPSNTTLDVIFDRDDVMYVLGSWSLYRKNEDGTYTSFSTPQYYSSLSVDSLNNIWLAGYAGAAKFNGEDFKTFDIDDGLSDNNVSSIVVSPTNEVWLCSGYYGITKITSVAPVPDFETGITCLPADASLINTSTRVDNLTRYEWDINDDGTVDYTTRDLNHHFESQGQYKVKLTAYNDDIKSEVIKEVVVLESPSITMDPTGTVNICAGDYIKITANLDNYDPKLPYSYSWNVEGYQGPRIATDTSGTYFVTVSNGACTTESDHVTVLAAEPYSEARICMVTVDSTTNKNLIIWERTRDAGIESYNIYKLYGNNYVPIGNVPFDEKYSHYTDWQSTPDALAARYALTVIDTCGNESDFSPYHQTIHLGASAGVAPNTYVLDWTPYMDEAGIFEPEWYYCWAGSEPDKLEMIFSIGNAFTEWNDTDPGDRIYYKIEVRKPEACFVTLEDGLKAGSGPFVHSLSNLEDNRLKSDVESFDDLNVSMYPNPMENWTRLTLSADIPLPATLAIYDVNGVLVRNIRIFDQDLVIERDGLESGFYIIQLNADRVYNGKLVVK